MDGCLPLVLVAISLVLLIAPAISIALNFRNRSRLQKLEAEMRTLSTGLRYLRSRFDERERAEERDQETAPQPEAPPEKAAEPVVTVPPDADAVEPVTEGRGTRAVRGGAICGTARCVRGKI